jgi:hypothetical protein
MDKISTNPEARFVSSEIDPFDPSNHVIKEYEHEARR